MLCEIFAKCCDLATALGHAGINKLPGCLEIEVDEHWWFAINAHKDAVHCSKETDVPGGHIYVMFNGWPAGILTYNDGCLAAGAAANEDTLIAALDAAIAKAEAKR
jgi:hypothetical protein